MMGRRHGWRLAGATAAGLHAALLAGAVLAQGLPPPTSQSAATPSGVVPAVPDASAPAVEAEPQPRRQAEPRLVGWRFGPRLFLSETYSDNLLRVPDPEREHGWLTQISPGLRLQGGGPRVQALLDYRRNEFAYSGHSDENNGQNLLNASASVEAIQDWFFLDAHARVTQLNASPFGPLTSGTEGSNLNRTETSALQLSPHIRGMLGSAALYQVRLNAAASHSQDVSAPGTTVLEGIARVRDLPGSGSFGWSAEASSLTVRNASVAKLEDSRARGSLSYAIASDLRVSAQAGVESTDFTGQRERVGTPGAGVEWSPSGRTQVAAVRERRFFGSGYSVLASHRTGFVALRYSDQKDNATQPRRVVAGGQGSVDALLSELLAASIPDPAARSEAVRTQLEQTGVQEYSPGSTGFVTTGAMVSYQRQATVTLRGRRNTAALVYTRSEFHPLPGGTLGLLTPTIGALGLRQRGYEMFWDRRLSVRTFFRITDSRTQTEDLLSEDLKSLQHAVTIALNRQVGPHTSVSLAGRRVRFTSSLSSGFVENAAVGTFAIRY